MAPNPIHRVLSTLCSHRVTFLLMGGQACVLYGAAEFSRDTDIVLMPDPENLIRLGAALRELQAECIAVPSFHPDFLRRGHAVHFRCHHPEADGIRIDAMTVLRGVAPFARLWAQRTTVEIAPDTGYDLLSLPDLVQAKKTQRDKDWFMLRRLVLAHFAQNRAAPTPEHIDFWLREAREMAMLLELARAYPERAAVLRQARPLLAAAAAGDAARLTDRNFTDRNFDPGGNIIEPAIGRDILMLQTVRRPALLRQVLALCAGHPAEVISLQKLAGVLMAGGALETIAHYLQVLEQGFLVAPLQKYSEKALRRRNAPPKLIVLNQALVSALHQGPGPGPDTEPERWGRWVENACLAHAWNSGQAVMYWREEPLEIEAAIDGPWGKWAVEVKTSRYTTRDLAGLTEFCRRYPEFRPLMLCEESSLDVARDAGVQAVPWRAFLAGDGIPG